jgi:FeS assembly SUF system protein
MGLFSFLKSNKDAEAPHVMSNTAVESMSAEGTDRPDSATDVLLAAESPGEASSWETDAAEDFSAKPDLNIDALVAPPAEAPKDQAQVGPADPAAVAELQAPIVESMKTVYDPEIPVDIYELGLIYDIIVDADRKVLVKMTLTSPACPSAQQIPSEVRYKVKAIPGVTDAWVEIVWEPPWDKDRMSEAAKLQLGFF